MSKMERDEALRFVAAQPRSGAYNVSPMDSDLYSWVIMNGDLFPANGAENSDVEQAPLFFDGPDTGPDAGHVGVGMRPESMNPMHKPEVTKPNPPAPPKPVEDNVDLSKLTPEQKKQRRLEKNREIARNCRKRKREKYTKLEEEIAKLRQYCRILEMKVSKGKTGREREDNRKTEVRLLEKMLKNEASETDLCAKLKKYKDMYADYGKERGSAIKYHMTKLKSLLIPGQVSKMTLWSLQQDDDFYDEKNNQKTFGGGIWNMLCNTLDLTAEQKRGLIDMRHAVRKQRRNVAECLRIMHELDDRVTTNFNYMDTQMSSIQQLLTPQQQAKFLLWIERNQACMHMLNNMWKEDSEKPSKKEAKAKPEAKVEEHPAIATSVKPSDMTAILKRNQAKSPGVTAEDMKAALQLASNIS